MHTVSVLSLCAVAAALTALPTAHAVPKYAKLIPNGSGVAGVTAVGHTDPDSGGGLNAFGKAFAAAGNAWTEALCKADSDGDGQTNGEELGDPCCTWKAGGTPAVASGAKDPGSASSKLDDATLKTSKALCGGAAAAPSAAPAAAPGAAPAASSAAPGTVKPADGATNETPALTPGTPAASSAAPAGAPGAAPAAAPAAGGGSDEYDWVPLDSMNKSSSSSTSATTPSATSSASSSATNSSKANTTSAAVPSVVGTPSSLVQVVAAAVVGAVALAL